MAELLLFHHALGLTTGVQAFADEIRAAGHVVHVPDLYAGRTFTELDDGVGHAEEIGFDTIVERGRAAAEDLPSSVVYAGFSLGAMPAQALGQTRPGAQGVLLMHSCIPLRYYGGSWPTGLPLQIHTMADDEWGDADVAQELVNEIDSAELFLYPGDKHLVTDNSLPVYDEDATALIRQRALAFLAGLDERARTP